MKRFVDVLTDGTSEELRNYYVCTKDNELLKLTQNKSDELTSENFKVLYVTEEGYIVATVEHICFYNPADKDFDFKVGIDGDWFSRENAPEEVVEFLDNELNKTKYEE